MEQQQQALREILVNRMVSNLERVLTDTYYPEIVAGEEDPNESPLLPVWEALLKLRKRLGSFGYG